jgi:hypothetical protein
MIKRSIALLASVIVACILPIIIIYLAKSTDFEFQTFGVMFIIPIGSILIGFAVGATYSLALKVQNLKIKKYDYIVLAFLALFTASNLYYSLYSHTYITDKDKIVYSYSADDGQSISQYNLKDSDEPINFQNYMLLNIENRKISFFYKNLPATPLFTTPEDRTVGWINFIIEFLGYFVGALFSIRAIITVPFCEKCNVYYKSHVHLTRSTDDADDVIVDLEKEIKSGKNLTVFFKSKKSTRGKINMEFESVSCPGCSNGLFIAKVTVKNKDGKYKTINNLTQYLVTKNDQVIEGNYQGIELLNELKKYLENDKNKKS